MEGALTIADMVHGIQEAFIWSKGLPVGPLQSGPCSPFMGPEAFTWRDHGFIVYKDSDPYFGYSPITPTSSKHAGPLG